MLTKLTYALGYVVIFGFLQHTTVIAEKCKNVCCTKILDGLAMITDKGTVLHSRTCKLLDEKDHHDLVFIGSMEIALNDEKNLIKCNVCKLENIDHNPCIAKCCKHWSWIIDHKKILHRLYCKTLEHIELRYYNYLSFICNDHVREFDLIRIAMTGEAKSFRLCVMCFEEFLPEPPHGKLSVKKN